MASKEIFRAIFDSLPQFVAMVRKDGTLLAVNRAGLAFINASADEVVDKFLWDTPWWAHSAALQEKLRISIGRAARGAFIRYKAVHPNAAGEAMMVDFSIKRIVPVAGEAARLIVEGRDITEQQRLEDALHAAARYARNLLESSLDPMLVIDQQGRITDVNNAAEKITGIPRDLLVGSDWTDCIPQPEEVQKLLRRVYDEGQVRDCPLFVRHENGTQTEVTCNVTLYRNEAGQVQGVLAVARDITDLREYEARLEFQASRDVLTGLPNRLLLRKHLERAVVRAERAARVLAVLFIDLDNFKDINDAIGHGAGDELLKATARRLKAALQENDTAARIGGDEFAVLIEAADAQDIEQWVNRLLHVVAAPHLIEGQEIAVSCSIGVTLYPLDVRDADALLRNADTAMYRAKERGTNNFQYFTAEMNQAVRRRIEISSCLRGALKGEEFTLHYQPRVDLRCGAVAGVEALIRWNSATIGAVSPAEFIPVAENNGMIVQIGEWVLRTACRQARIWQDMGMPVAVAVNFSARQFRDADVVSTVLRMLIENGLPPHLLELELTEGMLMHDAKRVQRTLEALKQTGVSLAIDDFGTGYSSLSYLKRFPLDYLKVDRSFVDDIPNDANDVAIVRAIIAMAHSLGLKVIAEGVETAEQMAFLQDQGCDQIQGYYFSRPLTAERMTSLLEESRRRAG